MNSEFTWKGKWARIIKTGELVKVISYDETTIQVQTSGGQSASFPKDEVCPVADVEEAGRPGQIQELKDKLTRWEGLEHLLLISPDARR